jgi:hypothetical protein
MTPKNSDTLTVGAVTRPDDARATSARAEFHAFAGTPREAATGLYALPASVVASSFYAFLMQADIGAEVRLFTQYGADAGQCHVEVWRGPSLGGLPSLIAELLTAETDNPELHESVASALREQGEFQSLGTVPRPPTARGAFGHPIRPFRTEQFIQTYVVSIWEE